MIEKINPKIIPYNSKIQTLCCIPYSGHPKGCINFGKKTGCPPKKLINDIFNFNKEIYVIFTEFAIGKFAERMRLFHPEWKENIYLNGSGEKYFSSRQWYNPRLWQETARKEHKKELEKLLNLHPNLLIDKCPEAAGVNVTGLMFELGIKLNWQWPPEHKLENKSYIVSLAGHSKT